MFEIILAPVIIGLILGPLGCFVLWKKYSYYGDGLAHSNMFTIVIVSILNVNILLASVINTFMFTLLVSKLKSSLGKNAVIGFVSSVMISLSLILAEIYPNNFNLEHLLFGDLFLINIEDIIILLGIFILSFVIIFANYKRLILMILSHDIASSKGIYTKSLEMLFLLTLSFAIIFTIKIVGALFVTSILIIPAIIARLVSNTPIQMICFSVLIVQVMNFFGMMMSLYLDFPFAPSIVISGALLYGLVSVKQALCRRA